MKWFKHLSNARDDERIAQLEDAAGLEGYGFYFKLLEIVASAMDGTDRCEVGYSISRWGTLTNCHPIKARTLVGKVVSCGLVESRLDGDRLLVRIPNLLKFRDNHTKNLQVTCKQEKEKEKEQETTNKSPPPAAPGFDAFWAAYPSRRRTGKGACVKAWGKAKLEAVAEQIVLHVEAMKLTPDWLKEDGKYVPMALTYLNQRRFDDGLPEAPRPRLVI